MKNSNYNIPVSITPQKIANLLDLALEQGSTYWIGTLDTQGDSEFDTLKVVNGESKWLILEAEEASRVSSWHGLNTASITRGLTLLAEHAPVRFALVLEDDADAEDADVWLQYALLGEVIYG